MAERFSSERVLELLFDDDFDLSDGCSSDEDSSEGPSYLGNYELHPQDLDALTKAVSSTEVDSNDRESSDKEDQDKGKSFIAIKIVVR